MRRTEIGSVRQDARGSAGGGCEHPPTGGSSHARGGWISATQTKQKKTHVLSVYVQEHVNFYCDGEKLFCFVIFKHKSICTTSSHR